MPPSSSKQENLTKSVQLEELTDHLPFLVAYMDTEHRFHFNNRAYEEWFGLDRETLKGKHIQELLGEDPYKELRPHLGEAFEGRSVHVNTRIPGGDGHPRVARISLIPHKQGRKKPEGLFVVVDDITHWKKMETEFETYRVRFEKMFGEAPPDASGLTSEHISGKDGSLLDIETPGKSEDVLIHVFNHIPSVLFLQDMEGRFLFINHRFETVFGVSHEDAFRRTAKEVLPGGFGETMDALIRNAHGSKETTEQELTLKTEKGEAAYLVDVLPLWDIDKQPFAVFGIATDISRRKLAEAEWRKSIKDLEKRVRERTRELERKNIALEEILSHLDDERQKSAEAIAANIEKMILPVIQKLEKRLPEPEKNHLTLLKENLNHLNSSFGKALSSQHLNLTSREIEICNMIKNGFSNKEIAEEVRLAPKTVETHRTNIRKKLGLLNSKINLTTFLKSL